MPLKLVPQRWTWRRSTRCLFANLKHDPFAYFASHALKQELDRILDFAEKEDLPWTP